MKEKPLYSIKKYMLLLVLFSSIGLILCAIILSLTGIALGFGSQGVLLITLLSFPLSIFSVLYAFYKGLIKYYGFKEKEKLQFVEQDVLGKVADDHPHKLFWKMALRSGLLHADTELQWIEECLDLLEK